MNKNNIKAINSSYFDYLINLEELNLSDNYHIEIIDNLSELKCLDLSDCGIKEIKNDTFLFNRKLEKVIFLKK